MTSSAWQGQGRQPEAVASELGPGGGGGCCGSVRVNALFHGPHFATASPHTPGRDALPQAPAPSPSCRPTLGADLRPQFSLCHARPAPRSSHPLLRTCHSDTTSHPWSLTGSPRTDPCTPSTGVPYTSISPSRTCQLLVLNPSAEIHSHLH